MSRLKTSERFHIRVSGIVQGVGFRPFVYCLAKELNLSGWVRNVLGGLELEVEGGKLAQERLLHRLPTEAPAPAVVEDIHTRRLEPTGEVGFQIRESVDGSDGNLGEILPDLASCPSCLREMFDPENRRYQYPFTNCIHCGPRYTVIASLPYDRCRTSLRDFGLCAQCLAEYEDPLNRRFHAQAISCSQCGPQLEWKETEEAPVLEGELGLTRAVEAILEGGIVAIKGIGGFHLFADATNLEAVRILRIRKRRMAKPFAVMFDSLRSVLEECEVSEQEDSLLTSRSAPIVLLRRKRQSSKVVPLVAPENPYLGVMLPYAPLHHLLLRLVGRPLVATSGNRGEEPICFDNAIAESRLRGIADGFLMHNYRIQRAVDDSVVCVVAEREMVLRRSRGYAPLSLDVGVELAPVLALGSDLKNTFAVTNRKKVVMSQHIGDLSNALSLETLDCQTEAFSRLLGVETPVIAHDCHPGYFSTRAGSAKGQPMIAVQHHHAHIAACLADNGLNEEVLGVVWDGSGFGSDGTVWGGEFLISTMTRFHRWAHLRSFPLLGGDQAVLRPPLAALALIFELDQEIPRVLLDEFSERDLSNYRIMYEKGIHCPRTSSMGRLFDAVAALASLSKRNRFEGETAMHLEFALPDELSNESYSSPSGAPLDWRVLIREVLDDVRNETDPSIVSLRFHNAMVNLILNIAAEAGRSYVALSGGCFQNRFLLERSVTKLRAAGFKPIWHQRVPPNDGGLSLGQACIAGRSLIEN